MSVLWGDGGVISSLGKMDCQGVVRWHNEAISEVYISQV